jgi:hypothetical protein
MNKAYTTIHQSVQTLSATLRADVVKLYLDYYDGSCAQRVLADLDDKDEILLLLHAGQLVGFTTLKVYQREVQGRLIQVIFSGDTVVHRTHWGQQSLAFACIRRMSVHRDRAGLPTYWLLIVKGHRTFRYLSAFMTRFYPHWAHNDPQLASIAEFLAVDRFGTDFKLSRGVVEFSESKGHLKAAYAHPDPREAARAEVRFFLGRNPGYLRGHELVCLCELVEPNMKPLTRRLFASARSARAG